MNLNNKGLIALRNFCSHCSDCKISLGFPLASKFHLAHLRTCPMHAIDPGIPMTCLKC